MSQKLTINMFKYNKLANNKMTKNLKYHLLKALEISGIGCLEGLTPKNLDGFKPLILKCLKDNSFLSKYRVNYQIQDIYFSEGKLKMQGEFSRSKQWYGEGCGPMDLPRHLQDIETSAQINRV